MPEKINLYGLAYDCPYLQRLVECPFKEVDDLSFYDKVIWVECLSKEEQRVILEYHLSCSKNRFWSEFKCFAPLPETTKGFFFFHLNDFYLSIEKFSLLQFLPEVIFASRKSQGFGFSKSTLQKQRFALGHLLTSIFWKSKQVETLDIVKVVLPVECLENAVFEKVGVKYLSFEIAKLKEADKFGRTHTCYYQTKDQSEAPKDKDPQKAKKAGKKNSRKQPKPAGDDLPF